MKAVWKGIVLAESTQTINIEGNYYFPPDSINMEALEESKTHTICHWKGKAFYYHVKSGGLQNTDAAWYYPETTIMAKHIKGYVAFWKGIEIVEK